MSKTPLHQLDQYQAGLGIVTVLLLGLGLFAPWGIETIALQMVCLVGGAIFALTLLLSIPIRLAAAAIIEARRQSPVD